MTDFLKRKAIETVLYILEKTGGVDIYHLLKILYFAEKKHLCEWGSRITEVPFIAYQYGPVPEEIYKSVRSGEGMPICYAGDDAPTIIVGTRKADKDYLSGTDMACLDESISENVNLTFNQLLSKSHDSAWQKAWETSSKSMDTLSIAQASGADEDTLAYIAEQLEFAAALS